MLAHTATDPFLGDDCVLWSGTLNDTGYGILRVLGDDDEWTTTTTHRVVLLFAAGDPPYPHLQAAHRPHCFNRHCFNPHHLYWATPVQNAADVPIAAKLRAKREAAA